MTREELLADLDVATRSGDLELARAIDAKLTALKSSSGPLSSAPKLRNIEAPMYNPSVAEELARYPGTRFAVGAGKGLVGTGQFLTNAAFQGMSPDLNKYINKGWDWVLNNIQRTEQMGNPDGTFNAAGFAGEVLNPVALGASKAIGPVQGAAKKIAQGATFGTVMGATQPVMDGDYESQKMVQLGVGGATGAAIPTVAEVMKFFGRPVLEAIKYLTPGGAERLAKKWVNHIVGPDNLKDIVADVERQLPSVGKGNVSSYRPTTGEMVSHIPEASPLLALQNRVSSLPGGPSGQFGRRALENREAINQALAPIAGTPQQLAAAEEARKATGNVLYEAATKATPKADEKLVSLASNPYFQKAWPEARRMSEASGKTDMTTYLHNVKLILDNELRKTGDSALNRGQRKIVGDLEREIVDWLSTNNKAYEVARSTFKAQSIPINRMQVGQALEKKLVSPTDQMTPGTYLRAIDDETKLVKNVLGQPRSDLGQVFSPQERATVNEIGGLLERQLAVKNPPVRTNLQSNKAADEASIDLPALLSRPVVFANFILKKLTDGSSSLERRIDEINAIRMLDPEKFVAALKTMPPGRASQIEAMLQQQGWSPMNTGLINPAVTGLLGQGQ